VPKGIKRRFVVIGDECPIGFGEGSGGFSGIFEIAAAAKAGVVG
jgi:hypothetical protein